MKPQSLASLLLSLALAPAAGCVDEAIVALGAGGGGHGDIPEGCWHRVDLDPRGEDLRTAIPALAFDAEGSPWIVQDVSGEGHVETQVLDWADEGWRARTIASQDSEFGGLIVSHSGVAVAIDPEGALHFTNRALPLDQQLGDLALIHVVSSADGWATTEITGPVVSTSPIAIGADGLARVIYVTSSDNVTSLWLATELEDGSWDRELVHEGHVRAPTLALVPNGTTHIAFVDICPGEEQEDGCLTGPGEGPSVGAVIHAWRDADGWLSETVAEDANWQVTADHWLGVDSDRRLHLAYAGDGVIRHATTTDAGWDVEDVSAMRMIDGRADVAMVVGGDDTVHIAVARFAAPKLVWLGGRDGRWTVEGVDGGGDGHIYWPSMAVRPDDVPCLAYANEQRLRYSCRCEAR